MVIASAVSSAPRARIGCPGTAVKIEMMRTVPNELSVCAARLRSSWEGAMRSILIETATNSSPISEAEAVPQISANVLQALKHVPARV